MSIAVNVLFVLSRNKPDLWQDLRLSFKRVTAVCRTDHVRGSPQAPRTIIEYSDYQCPYSKKMHFELKKLLSENSRVRWVFRNRPLESLHPLARQAAIAAECADLQGKFWDYSDALFSDQADLQSGTSFEEIARRLEMNVVEFDECLKNGDPENLRRQRSEATALEINMTPTIFVDGKRFTGVMPYSDLLDSVEK